MKRWATWLSVHKLGLSVGCALLSVIVVGSYGSPAQAAAPAVLCLGLSVVLGWLSWRIDSRLDDMPVAETFVTVIDEEEHSRHEQMIRRVGRETTRSLNTWALLYAAIGGIAPVVIAFARDDEPLPLAVPVVSVLAVVAATTALLITERRVLKEAETYERGMVVLQQSAERLTRP